MFYVIVLDLLHVTLLDFAKTALNLTSSTLLHDSNSTFILNRQENSNTLTLSVTAQDLIGNWYNAQTHHSFKL